MAPILKKDGITVNAIAPAVISKFTLSSLLLFHLFRLPNYLALSLSPPTDAHTTIETGLASEGLFQQLIVTPISTLIAAIKDFSTQPSLTGKIAEISGEKYTVREQLEYGDEDTKKNMAVLNKLGMLDFKTE
jgi:hypothetical protein